MCGVAGIHRQAPVALAEIVDLTQHLEHRGPDGTGHWISGNQQTALGHSRLSILDLSNAADQPMVSPSGRYTIVFNGEVYNFVELSRELQDRGYSFSTSSDTEVILAALEQWGTDALPKFNGMWALAVYDSHKKTLVLARDRYGVKPLYYYHDARQFVFASEIQAIERFPGLDVSANESFLRRLVGYDTSSYGEVDTYLNGVKSLPGGFVATVDNDGQLQTRQWYQLSRVHVPSSFRLQAEHLRELLTDACRIRLRSDVPVATCLSGGIDSGSIVSLLAAIGKEGAYRSGQFSHRSFTAAFPGTSLDETAAAEMLARQKGMNLDVHVVDCPTPRELERAMSACDGPMPALAFYPIWKLYEHIKQSGVSVTLDGQGADEMLGGYYLGFPALRGAWQARRPFWGMDLYRTYKALNPHAGEWIQNDFRAMWMHGKADIDQALKRPVKSLLKTFGLYAPKPAKGGCPPLRPVYIAESDSDCGNSLGHALWQQFFTNPLPFLLHQYDRCSMASGVECRMPFMDYRVVEFIFSLPLDSRIGGGYTKRVLREAMRGVLPEETRTNRLKTGFNAPFNSWLLGPLREWTEDQMASQTFLNNSLFDGNELRRDFYAKCDTNSAAIDERRLWPCLHIAWWQMQHQQLSSVSV
jgi:asparagine synthase (glutamine-hydrolysing)